MAAFTFSYKDTSGDRNIVGDVVSKVLEARELAEKEREFAQKQAEKYDTSLEEAGIERGYFFKKALGFKFGGEFYDNKKEKLKDILRRKDIAGQIVRGRDGQTKLSRAERFSKVFELFKDKSKKVNFRTQFLELYKGYKDDPMLRPMSPLVPKTSTGKGPKSSSGSKRISKEQLLLGLREISESINAIANAVGNSSNEVQQNLVQSNIVQTQIAEQLKTRNNTIGDKLDEIAKAINLQTQFQKQAIDKAEDVEAEKRIENIRDSASTLAFDNLMTKEDEGEDFDESNTDVLEAQSPKVPDAYEQMRQYRESMIQERLNLQGFESGGIVSGPDSGYLVQLHGDEMIIPLDNNYTQGEPSAMDGKVRQKPQSPMVKPLKSPTQKYETGSSVGSKVGFGISRQLGIAGGGTTGATKLAQPLVDAMSLPLLATGGSLIAATTNYVSSLGETGKEMSPQINQMIRPIADVFGVPPVLAQRAKAGTLTEAKADEEKKKDKDKKSMFDMFKENLETFIEKLTGKINDMPNPTQTNINPGPSNLNPINLEGFSPQEISDLGRIVKAEAGIDEKGGAHVLNAIMNRYRQIKSGKISPSDWGITGKTKEEVTIGDIIRAPNQFQPMRNGSFNRVTEEEGRAALNAAVKGGGLDPKQIQQNLLDSGKSLEEATGIAIADTFYNPTLSSNKPFSGATEYSTSNKHAFMSTPYGYKPEDLNNLQAVQQNIPTPKPSLKDLGQAITNNYGMNVHQKEYFNVPGYDSQVEAYKTTNGFDFYHKGNKIDMSSNNSKAEKVVESFDTHMKTKIGPQAMNRPDSTQQKTDQASLLRETPGESGATSIAMLNIPASEPKPKLNTPPPTAATDSLSPSVNPLHGAGIYVG